MTFGLPSSLLGQKMLAEPKESQMEGSDVAQAEVILIGLKPGMVLQVIEDLGLTIENKLIISLAAGVRTTSMEEKAKARFMRAMTNLPAAVCEAATAVARC